jgi:hypothetical protein
MPLSETVETSLREAESSLRNALSFAARTERPMVTSVIADLISKIDSVIKTNELLDNLEDRQNGNQPRGNWGPFFKE